MSKSSQHIENFDSLFREYYPSAVLQAQRYVKDINAARDIAQQVFMKLYEKKDSIKIETSFKAYLFRAIRNTAFTYLKKEQVHQQHSEAAFDLKSSIVEEADPVAYEQLVTKIKEIIASLPPRCQLIFTMNRFEGKKNKEIAAELDLSIRTVETQISYALKQLRAKLPKELLLIIIFSDILYVCSYF